MSIQDGGDEIQEEFDPKNYISVGVTERDVEMYKEVFDLFDVHKIGVLTPNDLRNALEMFGYHPKKHLIYGIISDLDSDESGGLDFCEFLKIMTDQTRPCDRDVQEDYERVFSYFDVDGVGYITKADLHKVCLDLGETVSNEELQEIMDKCDPGRGTQISFQSFYENMKEVVAIDKKRKGVLGRR